ncbi:MAG: hypothetical protein OXC05_16795 [Halieaceae bacterium]|nr:hypothetical protein [Halieaceae bacterium]
MDTTETDSKEPNTTEELLANFSTQEPSNRVKLLRHALTHFTVAITAFALWAAADTWLLLTDLAIANFLSIATAIVAGVVVSTVMHEWSHFLGAKLSGSIYQISKPPELFVFNYDFVNNSERQFNIMSWSGQAGSIAAIILLVILIPLDNPGRAMLVAAAIGSAIFGGVIEWPVLIRVRNSHNPVQELSKITSPLFNRSMMIGIAGGLLAWLAIA